MKPSDHAEASKRVVMVAVLQSAVLYAAVVLGLTYALSHDAFWR
jgi:hypothetical protein